MISHAAATVIPIAQPITPPKLAEMRKSQEVKMNYTIDLMQIIR